jgi:teichuronic acid biosynthesis glycosyltransferase TuaH
MHLLFFSDIVWEHLYQRPQQLATRLAETWPVLWIEPATIGSPRKWAPVRKQEYLHALTLPQFPYNARNPRVRSISRFLSAVPGLHGLLHTVQRLLLRRAFKSMGIDSRTCIAVVENFQFTSLLKSLHLPVILFDYIDDAFGFTDYPPYVREEWRETIALADVATATSSSLKAQIERERSIPVHLVENGVDSRAFMPASSPSRPADLPPSGRTIVIYVGTISRWFDFPLLDAALRRFPQYNFVLVGPVHPDVQEQLTPMRKMANLRLPGERKHDAVPAYLLSSTVGMIPFVRNTLTEAVNPVKLYEYAAAGLPIISTAFSDDLSHFSTVAAICRTHEEFLAQLPAAVAQAHDTGHTARLRAFARQNDWSARAAAIASLLMEQIQHREHATTDVKFPKDGRTP